MRSSSLFLLVFLLTSGAVQAQEANNEHAHEQTHPPAMEWSFSGPFGLYDRAQLQRGFQVYKQVCSACHSLELLSYRNLSQHGGPQIPEAQVKAIAAEIMIPSLDETGQPNEVAAKPSDRFRKPFANPVAAAAANGGKAPPDLSVMAKARGYERGFPLFLMDAFTGKNTTLGPDYIHALLTGYKPAPAGMDVLPGLHYNEYFPGHLLAMAPPLTGDGQIEYQDGSPQTVDQYAKDVAAFLMWTAEPKLEERRRIGFQVMVFLFLFAGLLYFTKRKVWADLH